MQNHGNSNWWHHVGCHMSPTWNLSMSSTADEKKLKENIEIRRQREYAPDFMPIESLLYRAWLDVSLIRSQNSLQSLADALRYVKEAEGFLPSKEEDKFAHVGYGTVVYSFFLWLHEEEEDEEAFRIAEQKLLDLYETGRSETSGDLHPFARAYVHATCAFALSRLGEEHLSQSINLFKIALRRIPDNKHWRFCLAKILFRKFNMQKLATYGYRNEPLSPLLEKKFNIVKRIFEKINQDHPNFHWANAYLGNVSCFLNTEFTSYVTEALHHEPLNIDIVLLAVRLFKQKRDFQGCIDLLKSLPEDFRTAEVDFQLGIMYFEQSKDDTSMQTELLHNSLANIEMALKKDSCKFPALLKRAEIYAKYDQLDENFPEKAKDFYRDVTKKCREKVNKRNIFHAFRSMTYKNVDKIFSPLKRVKNCYNYFVAIIEADEFASRNEDGKLELSPEYEGYAKHVQNILLKYTKTNCTNDPSVAVRAQLYLAKCKQMMGEKEEAKTAHEVILDGDKVDDNVECDARFGLAECYQSLGRYKEAEEVVKQLNGMTGRKNKLLADIYTSEAKQLQKEMMHYFAKATDMENLESCLEIMLANGNICQNLFLVQERTAIILAKINVCVNERKATIATNIDSMTNVKIRIKEKLDEAIMQPMNLPPLKHTILRDTFNGLSTLRSALLELECSLLCDETALVCSTEEGSVRCSKGQCERQRGESTNWRTGCQITAKEVLKKALSLFNQSIKCLQVTLLSSEVQDKVKQNSALFPILCWTNEDEADEFLASEDLQALLVELFPDDFEAYLPPDVFDYLLQLQPRVDRKNVWLEVLAEVVNNLKGDTLPRDSYQHYLGNERVEQNFCTLHLARKSCEEVEKLILTVLKSCQELQKQNKNNVG